MAKSPEELQIKKLSKYLTSASGGEEYGMELQKVRKSIRLVKITRVPRTQGFVRGVINLQGRIHTVSENGLWR